MKYLSITLISLGIVYGITLFLALHSFAIRDLDLARNVSIYGMIGVESSLILCAYSSWLDRKYIRDAKKR